jgi:hypothetical protein
MDIGAAFVADGEPAEAVEPGDRPFDDPTADTQSAAMRRAAARQNRRDPAGPKPIAMGLGVVAAVSLQRARLLPGATAATADGRQSLDQRIKLGDVVDVRRGYLRDERDAAGIRDEMVFGTRLAAIGWVRSSFFPPRTARTDPLSITVQRWSSRPRRRNSASNVS